MPVAGGDSGGRPNKGGKKKDPILTLPPAPVSTPATSTGGSSGAASTSSASRGGGGLVKGSGSAASGSSSSSSSSSSYDYTKAQRQRDMAARDRYVTDAEALTGQIKALRATLGPKGEFKDALKKRLGNIDLVLGQQMDDLDTAEAARNASLDLDARNNTIANADGTTRNDANRVRERTMALSEVAAQGGGGADALRAQLMSLRSAENNQAELDRAFKDSERSINNSRLDLALDVHNARVNMTTEANADKEQLWTTFNNQTSETRTQLGNALGQQAEYYGLARESARNAGGAGATTTTSSSSSASSSSGGKGGKRGGRTGVAPGREGGREGALPVSGRRALGGSGLPSATPGMPVSARPGPRGGLSPEIKGGGKGKAPGGKGVVTTDLGGGRKRGRPKTGGLQTLQDEATKQSDKAFMQAAQAQGRAWKNPGLPKELREWEAPVGEEKVLPSSLLQNARTTVAMKAPEGATLRKW